MSFIVQAFTFSPKRLAEILTKSINSDDWKNGLAASLTVCLCLVYLGLDSLVLLLYLGFSWPVSRVTICFRFSGTAPIKNILSCCQAMCPTMCPDIFVEYVASLLRIFSISLMGLSFQSTQRLLHLGWATQPSYWVCESQLMSSNLCRAHPAFSNLPISRNLPFPISYSISCYALPSI